MDITRYFSKLHLAIAAMEVKPTDAPALLQLPVEIIFQILTYADPISLLNIRHTCRRLMHIVGMDRHLQLAWLLQVELLPQCNPRGVIPTLWATDSAISPPWSDVEGWSQARYACAGCLRLLPVLSFKVKSVIGLAKRKPPVGSAAAEGMYYSWRPPCGPAAWWRRELKWRKQEAAQRMPWRRLYHSLHDPGKDTPGPGTGPVPEQVPKDKADDVDRECQKHLCGVGRDKRTCLECMFSNAKACLYIHYVSLGWS